MKVPFLRCSLSPENCISPHHLVSYSCTWRSHIFLIGFYGPYGRKWECTEKFKLSGSQQSFWIEKLDNRKTLTVKGVKVGGHAHRCVSTAYEWKRPFSYSWLWYMSVWVGFSYYVKCAVSGPHFFFFLKWEKLKTRITCARTDEGLDGDCLVSCWAKLHE